MKLGGRDAAQRKESDGQVFLNPTGRLLFLEPSFDQVISRRCTQFLFQLLRYIHL
jgi:hypothetical protein